MKSFVSLIANLREKIHRHAGGAGGACRAGGAGGACGAGGPPQRPRAKL